jgi:hypothetical protein
MSKSGSVAINCTNALAAGSQVREPVTRRERTEENWVRPQEERRFPFPVRAEAVGASKSGSTEISVGLRAHGGVARPLEARNEQKWVQQKKPARLVRIAELEGLA